MHFQTMPFSNSRSSDHSLYLRSTGVLISSFSTSPHPPSSKPTQQRQLVYIMGLFFAFILLVYFISLSPIFSEDFFEPMRKGKKEEEEGINGEEEEAGEDEMIGGKEAIRRRTG